LEYGERKGIGVGSEVGIMPPPSNFFDNFMQKIMHFRAKSSLVFGRIHSIERGRPLLKSATAKMYKTV